MNLAIHIARISDHAKVAVGRGQSGLGGAPNVSFVLHAIADQVGDREHFQAMRFAEFNELRNAGHGAVVIHHFADHARGVEAGDARQIDGSFRLSGADENAAGTSAQGVYMARTSKIFGARIGIGGGENRGGTIGGACARGGAAKSINWLAEGSAKSRSIALRNWLEVENVAALFGESEADQAAAEFRHEVDGFGRDLFGSHGQVAFVFAIFIVNKDDHAALADFGEGLFNGSED